MSAPQDFADTVAMGGDAPFVVWVWVGSTHRASLVAWFKPLFEQIVAIAQTIRWVISGFIIAGSALAVLAWGPGEPSTTDPSTSMTMAFAVVAMSAVNMGFVMRRERQVPCSSPCFPTWVGSCSDGRSPSPQSRPARSSASSTPSR